MVRILGRHNPAVFFVRHTLIDIIYDSYLWREGMIWKILKNSDEPLFERNTQRSDVEEYIRVMWFSSMCSVYMEVSKMKVLLCEL